MNARRPECEEHPTGPIDALLVIVHESPPSNEPSEGSLDHPASRQHLEALFSLDPSDDFDDELQERGLVHELGAIVCPVSEEMLEPWPALADGQFEKPPHRGRFVIHLCGDLREAGDAGTGRVLGH